MQRIVVAITGASGTILGYRTAEALLESGFFVEMIISKGALLTAQLEGAPTPKDFIATLSLENRERVQLHRCHEMGAGVASGSYRFYGMIIIPCSMATLAAVALGLADNLVRRCADVTLKERRRLVIVPRESPLSEIHLEHMLKVTRLGAVIVPPVPSWYTRPQTIDDVERFIVGKSLDALCIDNDLYPRWKTE